MKSHGGSEAWQCRAEEFLKLVVAERSTEVACKRAYNVMYMYMYTVGHVNDDKIARP